MRRVGVADALLVMAAAMPCVSLAQSTPGQVNDPSTYKGSLANQELERQAYQRQEAANQAMLERLDQSYADYAPQGGGGGGGAPVVNLKAKPLLPPASNPLLGRWQQRANKVADNSLLQALPGASIVTAALAGGCESVFGKGRVAFTPTQFNWVAPDGHEEILNHVEYHTDGSNVIVIPTDGDISFIFGFTDRDHAVVAFFGCRMEREGAKPAALAASTAPQAAAAAPAPERGVLKLRVGEMQGDRFSAPPAGTRIYVTPQDPDANLVKAGFVPDAAAPPVEKLFAACRIAQGGSQEQCNRGMQAMIGGAVGFVDTDAEGQAETAAMSPGRYYLVGFTPYHGHSLLWHLPVDVKAGVNAVSLGPDNGSLSR